MPERTAVQRNTEVKYPAFYCSTLWRFQKTVKSTTYTLSLGDQSTVVAGRTSDVSYAFLAPCRSGITSEDWTCD